MTSLLALALALLTPRQSTRYHIVAVRFATERAILVHYLVLHADTSRQTDLADIIISHVHWDHLDGADLVPKAHVWMQKAEYEHYVGPKGEALDRGIDTADAAMLAALRRAGRVTLIDGDNRQIMPGITVYTGGRHTYASQYVGVATHGGTVVLAGDDAVMYENIEQRIAIAGRFAPADTSANIQAQDRMHQIASDPHLIFPGHDPAIFTRYPKPGGGVARIR